MCTVVPRVSNFSPFRYAIDRFELFHIQGFPLTPMLKFQSATKSLILADCQNMHNLIYPYDCLIYHKVCLRLDKNCRRSGVLKFPASYGPVLTKMSKYHKIFNFRQIAKISIILYSSMTTSFLIKFRSGRIKTGRGVAF